MVLFRNSSSSTKRFLVIDEKYGRTSLRVYEPAIGPFAKKRSSESINHLTSWSLETSYELYGHGGLPQSVLQLQSSFPHSTTFLADLSSLDYRKRDGNATCKDYFPISDALEYTPKYWEWTKDILKHYEPILERAHIRDTIFASLFTYDWQMNVILSFYNHWNPATNTLSTPNGEEFISLWELKSCSGLPIFGTFYDEVIPSTDELNEERTFFSSKEL